MQSGKKISLRLLPALFCLLTMLVVACGGSTQQAGPTSGSTRK